MDRRTLLFIAISVAIIVLYQELVLRNLAPPPAEQAPTPAGQVRVVAAAFVPSEDWQLACAAGDRVTVTTEDDGLGWVEVVREADGAKGLVPLSYLTAE